MSAPYTLSSSLISPAACGPAAAFFSCVLVLGLGVGSVIVFLFLRFLALRRAQEHEHALLHEGAAKPLSAGPGRVVFGRVEVDGAEDVALAIDIVQRVENRQNKNSTSHVWNEVSRSVRASPFYLVRDDGVSVYVEPSEGALVVDVLETSYPIDTPLERVRRADVRRGEQFYAYGDLVAGAHPRAEGAYRDGVGWILKTPRSGRMLLATEGIRERYGARISFLRGAAIGLALAFCVLHGFFTLPFVVASLVGEHATAEVTNMRTYITHGKHGPITHYVLDVRTEDGVVMEGEVPGAAYAEARRARATGAMVLAPIVRSPGWESASYVGEEACAPLGWVIPGPMVASVVLVILWLVYRGKVAWYDRKTLVERGGTGFWRETRPAVGIGPEVN